MNKTVLISVDLQRDFSTGGGTRPYKPHPNVRFVKETLVPFCQERGIKIAEIISDYRQPRLGLRDDCCHPGTPGYESEIVDTLKLLPIWVKSMPAPIWTRKGIGDANCQPGIPYQDPEAFGEWLSDVVGKPGETNVVLIGLTLNCCVLCVAQELTSRGYKVQVLEEGVDTLSGDPEEKQQLLDGPVLYTWATGISWKELKEVL
ncbi:MAG TPA: isochorismatase family protein [Candidatus Saccharibacteria bacterium]|nr:isochorismatase family protein [Candidatus Saccharibacteria bacterium]